MHLYLKGDWAAARTIFEQTRDFFKNGDSEESAEDGPSKFLLRFIEKNGTDEKMAMIRWKGYRENVL